jgi:hypothetical protein
MAPETHDWLAQSHEYKELDKLTGVDWNFDHTASI